MNTTTRRPLNAKQQHAKIRLVAALRTMRASARQNPLPEDDRAGERFWQQLNRLNGED